jgi:fatty-acyl-CoA synthase
MMENRPEFLFTWIGLAKLGIITAFINFRLTGSSLLHVIKVSTAKHIILGK